MWAGALADEGFYSLASWAFGGGEAFFVFGEVFGEALALGGDVDGAFVEDGDVEASGAACVVAGEGQSAETSMRLTRARRARMSWLNWSESSARLVSVDADGRGFFLGDAEFLAQGADGGDELLKGKHSARRRVSSG
jgi:hypothetical protein